VHAVIHAVGLDHPVDFVEDLLACASDVHGYRLGAPEQPVHVVVGEGEGPLVQPERLPHAVAQKESRVEHGDLGFRARQQLAVDRDEYALVARIVLVLVGPHPTPQNSTPVRRLYIDA